MRRAMSVAVSMLEFDLIDEKEMSVGCGMQHMTMRCCLVVREQRRVSIA